MRLHHESRELGDYYEEEFDGTFWLTIIGLTLLSAIALTAIFWQPDVEAIGTQLHALIFGV